jgi:hypothetical protein
VASPLWKGISDGWFWLLLFVKVRAVIGACNGGHRIFKNGRWTERERKLREGGKFRKGLLGNGGQKDIGESWSEEKHELFWSL